MIELEYHNLATPNDVYASTVSNITEKRKLDLMCLLMKYYNNPSFFQN